MTEYMIGLLNRLILIIPAFLCGYSLGLKARKETSEEDKS